LKHIAYIALGGNVGDVNAAFDHAIARLVAHPRLRVDARSSRHRTAPLDCPPGSPDFWNAVVRVRTDLSPLALLAVMQKIEQTLGRERSVRNAPRTIDLDLLLFDDLRIETPQLQVPHPRMRERPFVMTPLAEVWLEGDKPTSDAAGDSRS
jgi:2-amino-4-hydroxy-6-hydroxymethyldihydropteridine diphosphokinase